MAKRRPTGKTPRQRSTPAKPAQQECRAAARNDARAKRTISHSRQDALALVALGLLVVVCYLPAMLWGGFVWDDEILTSAQAVQDGWSGLWRLWSGDAYTAGDTTEGHYWPLVYTTFWLEHKLWGFAPRGYHIVNVLLHLANTLLLWHLVRRLAVPGAWMVAAVFAVHPLHVESVAWVIERKDVLSGLFYLAAVLAWLRFVEKPRRGWYAWSLVLYAAALLSKSIALTLPVALLIWHWWKQGRVTSTDLLRLVPFGALGLVIALGDLSFYQSREALSLGYSFIERTFIAARALWFYAGKLLWPTNLAIIYPRWDIRVSDPLAWGHLVATIALAVALWRFQTRLGRGPLAGALFFAVTLSPVLGFVDYGYMQFAFVADRFQYLAGIGVTAVVIGAATYGVGRLSDLWHTGARVVAAVVIVVLGLQTWKQASVYRDDETLNRHIIALNPQARDAYLNLGDALYEQGRYAEALDAVRIAVERRPEYAKAHFNLGAILDALGRYEEAETHLRRAIALKPQNGDAYLNLGDVLYKQSRYAEALDATRIAIEQEPDFAEAHFNLGAILNVLGRFAEAETHLRRAIALKPQDGDAHFSLGAALYKQGRYAEALDATRIAIEQEPEHLKAHFNLGVVLDKLGRFEEAETHLRRAIALKPQDIDSLRKLIEILTPQGRYEEAIDLIAQAVALDPSSPQAAELHYLMGQTAQENGQSETATAYYIRALEIDPHYAKAIRRLAHLRAEQQRYDESLELFQRLIDIDPGDAMAHGNMGIVLFYLGNSAEALQRFDQALSLNPNLENARANREALLKAMEGNRQ